MTELDPSIAHQVITLMPDPGAQAGPDDDGEPRGYFVGECGHPVPLVGAVCYVGPCDDCDPGAT